VPAPVGHRERHVGLPEVGHLDRRVAGSRGQRRGRAPGSRRARPCDLVELAAIDEGNQQEAARPGRDHRLSRSRAERGIELLGGRELTADDRRDEDVGHPRDALEVDDPAVSVPGDRHPQAGRAGEVGAGAVQHHRRARGRLSRCAAGERAAEGQAPDQDAAGQGAQEPAGSPEPPARSSAQRRAWFRQRESDVRPRSDRDRNSRSGPRLRAPGRRWLYRSLRNEGMSISSSRISSEERWISSIVTSRSRRARRVVSRAVLGLPWP
jgi:hypothetical protein